jgi:hypothetical protein
MSADPAKSEYLLLFRGLDWHRGMSPGEVQKIMIDWMAWSDRLVAEGRSKARSSLSGGGKIISGKDRKVSDGPFAEAKEAVAGYFLLEVSGLDEAVEIARECPTVPFGAVVEVRPMPAQCLASVLAAAPLERIAEMLDGRAATQPAASATELAQI